MKNYPRIVAKLFYEPLLITPQRHAALCHLLDLRMANSMPMPATAPADAPDDPADGEDMEMTTVGKTAIIPVHGTLVQYPEDIAMSECGCAMEDLNALIDTAEADPEITRVIYDFRTPGGGVTGIPETARKILNSQKETVAFTESECCSGGLWLAAQCQSFYSTASATIGSVGVYTMTMDISRQLENEGVKLGTVQAGKYKTLGAYWKPMTEDERAILQRKVDKIYKEFKTAMESHRMVDDANFGSGLTFDGEESAAMGFTNGCVEDLDEILDNMTD